MSPPYALKNRSLLSLDELSARDLGLLLELACTLKREQAQGQEQPQLRGLHIATLARAGAPPRGDPLAAAAAQQGAMLVRVEPHTVREAHQPQRPQQPQHAGSGSRRELPELLGRLYDAVEVRGMSRPRLRDFAGRCGVPVYRDMGHPTHPVRVVAELLTMQEQAAKPLGAVTVAWLGDPRGDCAGTLLRAMLLMGLELRLVAARECWPVEEEVAQWQALAQSHGARLSLNPPTSTAPSASAASPALAGCDFCYADRHALPLRSAHAEPALLGVNGAGGLAALRDPVQQNHVHAVKALLVATLA